jgi:hypothetical protein
LFTWPAVKLDPRGVSYSGPLSAGCFEKKKEKKKEKEGFGLLLLVPEGNLSLFIFHELAKRLGESGREKERFY